MQTLLIIVLLGLGLPLVCLQAWIVCGMGPWRAGAPPARAARINRTDRTDAQDTHRRAGTARAWPSVSVIVPAHNEAARLEATLSCLAAQRYPGPHEFVVVDDRSTDGTAALVSQAAAADPRFRLVQVSEASRRNAPKVNAVRLGIQASGGEVIVTTDADCGFGPDWLEAMVESFAPGVVMVCGYVETDLPPGAPLWARLEAADWFSLMLVSRSMLRSGRAYASSANNQAYLRSAFLAAGGFGATARAPSGDEDLLAQRLARLPGARVVFAADRRLRVRTASAGSPLAFLRQRRRWVSRYQHMVHYSPSFVAGLSVLGLESIVLAGSLVGVSLLGGSTLAGSVLGVPQLAAPLVTSVAAVAKVALAIYALQTAVHLTGMSIGMRQLGRADLGGLTALAWALVHPLLISAALIWSWLAPGDWRTGAADYRVSLLRRRWRLLTRELLRALYLR